MNDDAMKSDRFRGDGFRVIPVEGFRPPSERFRDVANRSQSPKDLYSLPNRDKDSMISE